MTVVRLLLAASLLVPATARADDPDEEEETTSYREYTLTTDLVGLSLLVAGGMAEGENGRDTDASGALFAAGSLTSVFGSPIIHLARGHTGRAVGSFGMRLGFATLGASVAMMANSDCHHDQPTTEGALLPPDFLCELDYVGYGVIGGLVVASVVDAAFFTDEKVERATWSPQLAATRDGVRVGAAWAW